MYQQFFGFKEYPFNVTPDPRFLYLSSTHNEALAHLRYGIEQRKGFTVISGEVGCGKTLLCRTLLNALDDNVFESAWLYSVQSSFEQLIRSILREFGVPQDSLPTSDHLDYFNDFLLAKAQVGKEVILIIDEAQNLSYDVLESIRLLSNLETEKRKLLQIILLGQPELRLKLNQPQLRQLRQRILVYYELKPLSKSDAKKYIDHRISLVARESGVPKFSYGAISKIVRYSNGVPRILNNVCDKSLLAGYSRLSLKIERKDVKKAIANIERLSY